MKLRKHLPLYIVAIFWATITIYPLIFTALSSLKNNTEIYTTMFGLPEVYRFDYYKRAFIQGNMAVCIRNSFILALSSTAVTSLLASSASYVLTRMSLRINKYVMTLFTLGLMIPIHSTLIPLVKMVSSFKGQNSYLTMIVLYTAFNISLSLFIIAGYMRGISREIDEAGIIDGCSQIQLFWHIILPLIKPAVATAAILAFLFIYNDLIFALMFLSDASMHTISIGLMAFVGLRSTELGPTFASIILTILPMVIVYLLFQERVESGMTAGATKG